MTDPRARIRAALIATLNPTVPMEKFEAAVDAVLAASMPERDERPAMPASASNVLDCYPAPHIGRDTWPSDRHLMGPDL